MVMSCKFQNVACRGKRFFITEKFLKSGEHAFEMVWNIQEMTFYLHWAFRVVIYRILTLSNNDKKKLPVKLSTVGYSLDVQ